MAVGTFEEDYTNRVEIVQWDEEEQRIKCLGSFDHPYPPTKVMFHPSPDTCHLDQVVTVGDYLRLWTWSSEKGKMVSKSTLNHNKTSEYCAPLTSVDWSPVMPSRLVASSVDTTCTVWDLERQMVDTKLIAHDSDVFDVTVAHHSASSFASVGADKSLRLFDLRTLDHSTIVHEADEPLLRVSWNRQDSNYLAVTAMTSHNVTVIDVRTPSSALTELRGHGAPLSGIDWAPKSHGHLASAGSDSTAFIWDVSDVISNGRGYEAAPMLNYLASSEVNQIHWSRLQSEWLGITHGACLEMLHV